MTHFLSEDMKRFNYLIHETDEAYHEAALKLNLSDSTMMILYTAWNGEGECPLREVCHLSGISKQTINSALRKLESEEILYLKPSDSREKQICLTDKGKALAQATVRQIAEIENEIFDEWPKDDRRVYIELTQRYLDSFKEKSKRLTSERNTDENRRKK